MKIWKIFYSLPFFFVSPAFAGYIVQNGTVTAVSNISNATNEFSIKTENGTGPCSASSLNILFRASNFSDPAMMERAFSVALTALSTGLRVDIYDYGGDDCTHATYIRIHK